MQPQARQRAVPYGITSSRGRRDSVGNMTAARQAAERNASRHDDGAWTRSAQPEHNPGMSLAHLTLPTQNVDGTASFFERTLGYARNPVPGNSPVEALWLDIGRGQEMHVFYVDQFAVS